jgi:predicted lipid-binding transport protein (Tim44 family)
MRGFIAIALTVALLVVGVSVVSAQSPPPPPVPQQPPALPGAAAKPGAPAAAAKAPGAPVAEAPKETPAQPKFFRWVDKNGVVNYSDSPPLSGTPPAPTKGAR